MVDRRFHQLTVLEVVRETADASSFVLSPLPDSSADFTYSAGQYCTFRLEIDDTALLRCYSMSSSPTLDGEPRITVKRIAGGRASNWLIENVKPGDTLEATTPSGNFVLPDTDRPILAFAGGSGITPVFSILRTALATTGRPIHLLLANRDAESAIFRDELTRLADDSRGRLTLNLHHDDEKGLVSPQQVLDVVDGDLDVDVFICGPTAFMDLVESTIAGTGIDSSRIHTERFTQIEGETIDEPEQAATLGSLILTLDGSTHELTHRPGETILETARRSGLSPPFSCQAGNCATCIARICEGSALMKANDALDDDEVAAGWVLTCQAVQQSDRVVVVYGATP